VGDTLDARVSNHLKKAKGKKVLRINSMQETPVNIFGEFYQNIINN
jgi:hypothetical protein